MAEAEEQRKADLIAAIVRRREAKRAALMPEPAPTPPSTPSGGGEGATAAAASALVRGGSYRGTALTLDALPTWGGRAAAAPPAAAAARLSDGGSAQHCFSASHFLRQSTLVHTCVCPTTPSYRFACTCRTD